MTEIQFPEKPLDRFLEIYSALNADRKWYSEVGWLRFASITALACHGDGFEVARNIRRTAEEIKKEISWWDQLNSPLRYIISAILVLHEDKPSDFIAEIKRVRELFRQMKMKRGNIYETMAILILRLNAGPKPIEKITLDKFKALYEEIKKYHWFLTGPDDFPACAILVSLNEDPVHIALGIEDIYNALRERKFSRGNPLQTAANVLYLSKLHHVVAADRFEGLAKQFKANKISIWQSFYDELAILSFLNHPAEIVVQKVIEFREAIRKIKPKPPAALSFNLASSITFIDLVQKDKNMSAITDAKALMDMQNIINAQQAAAIAAASSAAAASAATSA